MKKIGRNYSNCNQFRLLTSDTSQHERYNLSLFFKAKIGLPFFTSQSTVLIDI